MSDEYQSQDTGEVQEVLAREEDRLESGEFCDDEVENESEDKHHSHFCTVGVQG